MIQELEVENWWQLIFPGDDIKFFRVPVGGFGI
jgi:hypothetical protein